MSLKRLVEISKKPDKKEMWRSFKICMLGIAAVGGIAYIIQLIVSLIQLAV
ncbi:protein translocase SEC61 complex subunit gamma [Candidatus Bathyarchaeota archaeon ex4484_205]|nr:MAG: protein translocase SEC61 complex subunit gamma [Candidatus Bathyarchaeota archaeon ex4484_205]RLG68925.1 MAG: protein translocase SEC61 complex subunit gamma [archaeon]